MPLPQNRTASNEYFCPDGSQNQQMLLQLMKSRNLDLSEIFSLKCLSNLEVRNTKEKGMGLFYCGSTKLPIGKPIGPYTGKLATSLDAVEDERYTMTLKQNSLWIDATSYGNDMVYVNHSCDPNCTMIRVLYQQRMVVILKTIKEISPQEELTFDYQWTTTDQSEMESNPCFCGSATCRKSLFRYHPDENEESEETNASEVENTKALTNASRNTGKYGSYGKITYTGNNLLLYDNWTHNLRKWFLKSGTWIRVNIKDGDQLFQIVCVATDKRKKNAFILGQEFKLHPEADSQFELFATSNFVKLQTRHIQECISVLTMEEELIKYPDSLFWNHKYVTSDGNRAAKPPSDQFKQDWQLDYLKSSELVKGDRGTVSPVKRKNQRSQIGQRKAKRPLKSHKDEGSLEETDRNDPGFFPLNLNLQEYRR